MNCSRESLTRYVEITQMMSSLSVWRMYKFIWKQGAAEHFWELLGIDVGEFLERRGEQKVLKGISFSWQQLLRTELAFQMTFQCCRRHSAKSSWSYRNGLCRKNKHLVEEEQSSKKRAVNQREIEGRKMLEEGRREERRVLPGKSSPNNSFLTSLVSKFAK